MGRIAAFPFILLSSFACTTTFFRFASFIVLTGILVVNSRMYTRMI